MKAAPWIYFAHWNFVRVYTTLRVSLPGGIAMGSHLLGIPESNSL
jgi:hypothetical protein